MRAASVLGGVIPWCEGREGGRKEMMGMGWTRGRPGPGGRLWGRVRAGAVDRARRAVRAIGRLWERRAGPSSCAGTCEAVQRGRGSSGAGDCVAVVYGRRGVEWRAVNGVGGRVARGSNVVGESFWKKFGIEVDIPPKGCIVEVRRRDNDPTTTGEKPDQPRTNHTDHEPETEPRTTTNQPPQGHKFMPKISSNFCSKISPGTPGTSSTRSTSENF